MRPIAYSFVICLAVFHSFFFANLVHAQRLTILGGLNPDLGDEMRSAAYGVSSNGNYVVGQADSQAFLWSRSSGMQGLGFLQTEISFVESSASGVSNDGQVVVGSSVVSNGRFAPFRWTSSGAMMAPLGPGFDGEGTGVSSSGDRMVGSRIINDPMTVAAEAFHWSSENGMVNLGYLSGAAVPWSRAIGASKDGRFIVGESANAQSSGIGNNSEAFRWSEDHGMVGLGMLPGATFSYASGVSSDGSVVVGGSGSRAFAWSALEGILSLEVLPGVTFNTATAVSADGSRIIGDSLRHNGQYNRFYATLWTGNSGTHFLEDLLIAANVNLNGWELLTAKAISADGQVIVGEARKLVGNDWLDRGFVADFRVVPEPSSLALAISLLLPLVSRNRKRIER